MGGVYIIAKQEKILYIGESEKDIRKRINRHMEKIKIRKDRCAEFIKLEHHHGQLTIYSWHYLENPLMCVLL
jgi:predicted GIY-YIG superfamily endonuclease